MRKLSLWRSTYAIIKPMNANRTYLGRSDIFLGLCAGMVADAIDGTSFSDFSGESFRDNSFGGNADQQRDYSNME
jgi:hypothetical protein